MQQPVPPQQPVKSKKPIYKRVWFWLLVIVIIAAIGSQLGNKGGNTPSNAPAKSSATSSQSASTNDAATAKVEMQATSTGKGTVIWGEAGSSNTEEFTTNWSKTITGDEAKKGYVLTVTGDIMGDNSQKVGCTVLVNGQQKSHKEGSGQSGSAMCDTTGIFN